MRTLQTLDTGGILTVAEAERYWRISRGALSLAIRRGRLPARRGGGRSWLVAVADVVRYQRGRWYPDLLPEQFHDAARAAADGVRCDA